METVLVYYVSLCLSPSLSAHLLTWENLTSWLYSSSPVCQMKVEYVRYVFGIHPHMCPLSSVKVDQPRPRRRRRKKQLFRMIISVCLNLRGKNHTGGPGQLGWCRVSQPPKRRVKPTLTCRSLSVCVHANLKQMLKSVCQIVTTSSLDPVEIYFFFFFFFLWHMHQFSMTLLCSLPPCLTSPGS